MKFINSVWTLEFLDSTLIVHSKRAIAPAVIAVILVVIIVVAGAGAYLVLTSKPSSTSSVSATSTSMTSSMSSSSISKTSSQSSSTSSSSSTTAVTSGYTGSCVNYSATNTVFNVIPLLKQYTSMALSLNGSSGNHSLSLTENYDVNGSTPSGISVNIDYASANFSLFLNAVISPNGTVDSVNGSRTSYFVGEAPLFFFGFALEVEYDDSIGNFTSASLVHSTGTSTVTVGTVSIPVTTYTLNSSPETVSYCGGTDHLTAFTISEGTPPGATIPLVTDANFAGSGTSNGVTTPFNIIVKITSIAVS